MTYSNLESTVREFEGQLAPGSETALYGEFVSRMYEIGPEDWRESEEEVPGDEVRYWIDLYILLESNPDTEIEELKQLDHFYA